DVRAGRIFARAGTFAEYRQPALRTAVRSLCPGADRTARGLHLGIPQIGEAEQGRSRSAVAGGVAVPQPSADRRAYRHGRPIARVYYARDTRLPLTRRTSRRISSTLSVASTCDVGSPLVATTWSMLVDSAETAASTCR